jgi:hypothetical protein
VSGRQPRVHEEVEVAVRHSRVEAPDLELGLLDLVTALLEQGLPQVRDRDVLVPRDHADFDFFVGLFSHTGGAVPAACGPDHQGRGEQREAPPADPMKAS